VTADAAGGWRWSSAPQRRRRSPNRATKFPDAGNFPAGGQLACLPSTTWRMPPLKNSFIYGLHDVHVPGREPSMIRITNHIAIEDSEIAESFIRASGPGGQNVNKLSTAVQLRFGVRQSPSLPDEVRARLERLAGKRLTRDGVLVITAQRFRTQERNREDALARLVELIRAATVRPVKRRPTKPTFASKVRRLEGKKRRGDVKALRGTRPRED